MPLSTFSCAVFKNGGICCVRAQPDAQHVHLKLFTYHHHEVIVERIVRVADHAGANQRIFQTIDAMTLPSDLLLIMKPVETVDDYSAIQMHAAWEDQQRAVQGAVVSAPVAHISWMADAEAADAAQAILALFQAVLG